MFKEPIIITPASGAVSVFKAGMVVGGLAVAAVLAIIAIVSSDET